MKNDGKTAWLGIYIGEPDWRSKGIGKTVMALYEEECRSLGYQRIELGVFSHNAGAIRLYERSGFTQIGVIPHFTYSQGEWRDDIRMEKIIRYQFRIKTMRKSIEGRNTVDEKMDCWSGKKRYS